jgi:hypothetical protein
MTPTWKHIHFTQPYNINEAAHGRINIWNEWESVIK